MGELKFRVQAIRTGSAARSAEDAARETPIVAQPQVRAGSSARLAERAKRAGEVPTAPMPSIALRAQGGRITRSVASTSPSPAHTRTQMETPEPVHAAGSSQPLFVDGGSSQSSTVIDHTAGTSPSRSSESAAGRFKSFLRKTFSTGEAD